LGCLGALLPLRQLDQVQAIVGQILALMADRA
jgi:hypothetical protein